jgi:hypothetical protein
LLQTQLGSHGKSFDDFSNEVEVEDDNGGGNGGGSNLTCIPSHFSTEAHAPTSTELAQFAKTYVADEAVETSPPPSLVITVTGEATAILSGTGAVTYNGSAKTIDSICFVTADNQIVAEFTDGGHIDFRANGTMTGVATITPTLLLIQPRPLSAFTGSYDLICSVGSLDCTAGTPYALVITPDGQASINGQTTSGTPSIADTGNTQTFIFGSPPTSFSIYIENGAAIGATTGNGFYGSCGSVCS